MSKICVTFFSAAISIKLLGFFCFVLLGYVFCGGGGGGLIK